jgi:phospholipid/cholesterol/gamma-HCH transport system substrate-binding protein
MPRNVAQEVKVGIFVAAGLAIFALFIIALTGLGLSGGEDAYRVRFKSVAGLENGSVVRLGGLKIGRVESVGISKEDPRMMEALIHVSKGSPIRQDSLVQVTSVGVTGSMYLSITLGTPSAPQLKSGAVLTGQDAASFQDVINEARNAASRLNHVLEGLDETANQVFSDIRSLVNNARSKVTSILNTTDRVVGRTEQILSEKNEQNIRRFLASLADAADKLEGNIGPAAKEFQITLKRARKSLDVVDNAANSFGGLSTNASDFVTELKKRLTAADRLLARYERVGEGLEKVFASGEEAIRDLTKALEKELQIVRQDLQREVSLTGTTIRSELGGVGNQARASLKESGEILNRSIGSIEDEIREVRKGLQKEIDATGHTVRQEVEGVGGEAKAAIRKGGEKLSDALGAIEGAAIRVDQFLSSNQKDLKAIVVNFRSISKRMDNLLLQVSGGEGEKKIKEAMENMRQALVRANSLMSQLDDTVASHREDIQILITDLRETASNLNQFTATLKDRPSSLILSAPAAPPRTFGQ